MEQQKVLIIIISAALFIAAVLGVGLALFYPDAGEGAGMSASAREFDPIEYARPPRSAETAPQEDESVIVYGGDTDVEESADSETEERVILLTEEERRPEESSGETATTVTSRSARSSEPEAPGRDAPAPRQPESSTSREAAGEPTAQSAAPPAQQPASYQTAPAPEREPRRMRVTEYWIQLISSPNKERVDLARERLVEEYSLGGRLTTTEVDDQIYYRFRVGPYDDRGEAEKFLSWIREIDGFQEAYISEEYPLRTIR